MNNIGSTKYKACEMIQNHLGIISQKPYPYNHNEMSDLVDELTDLYADSEIVSQDLQCEYEALNEDYDNLENEAKNFVNEVNDLTEQMIAILDTSKFDVRKLTDKIVEMKRLCNRTYF
jgi:hypothetical protein